MTGKKKEGKIVESTNEILSNSLSGPNELSSKNLRTCHYLDCFVFSRFKFSPEVLLLNVYLHLSY